MMEKRKIVLIGAGSAMFTRSLMADLVRDGGRWQAGLVDIDPQALAVASGLCQRMVALKKAPIEVVASLDRRELLGGADVVVATVGVGGRRAWELDVFIPRKYGVYQPVGDSVTVGGIFRALRMAPVMVEIARDVARLCPKALFFNYSNPMSVNCRAIRKATEAQVIGLCHGVPHVHRYLAQYIGVPPETLKSVAVGVNHLTWFTELLYQGRDAWPLVKRRLAEEGGKGSQESMFSWELYRVFGAFPAVLDRHVTEFFPATLGQGAYYGKSLGVDVFSFEATIANGDAIYAEMAKQARGESGIDERIFNRAPGEHEQLLEILHALWEDRGTIFSVNLPNGGQVNNLPRQAILETPAMATANGLKPLAIGDLPAGLAAIMNRVVGVHEITAEAALRGDRQLVLQALLADGAITQVETAERLTDEMLAAHKAYLPQFR